MSDFIPEDLTGSESVPANSLLRVNGQVVLVDVRVPSGSRFHMLSFANFADDVLAFGNPGILWTVLVDGIPHPNFNRVRDQLGLQVNPRVLPDGLVKARNRLQVVAENDNAAGGSAYVAGASIQGEYRGNR